VLGDEEDLEREDMQVNKLNWIKYEGIEKETEVLTKIRYKDSGSFVCNYAKFNRHRSAIF
jgi:tRNA-specific 2-thiouridylase